MVKWEPQKGIMRDRLRNGRSRTASLLVSCKVAVAGEAGDTETSPSAPPPATRPWEIRCQGRGKSGVRAVGNPVSGPWEIRCQGRGKSGVSSSFLPEKMNRHRKMKSGVSS